jgi:predicted nucleic acid-binding protein
VAVSDKGIQVLIDSDAFIAWFKPDDIMAPHAEKIFTQIFDEELRIATTSLVVAETVTTLSNRTDQATAKKFLITITETHLPVIHITEALQQEAIDLFVKTAKKGTSMVDCANVIVLRHFKIPNIFSFDGFYKRLGLSVMGAESKQ